MVDKYKKYYPYIILISGITVFTFAFFYALMKGPSENPEEKSSEEQLNVGGGGTEEKLPDIQTETTEVTLAPSITVKPSATRVPTIKLTSTPSPTATVTVTPSPTQEASSTPTSTPTMTPTPTDTPTPTPSVTPTP